MSEETIKSMLPTVTFRPSGAEHFLSLMNLMVGTRVEITFVEDVPEWAYNVVNDPQPPMRARLQTKRGEIVYVEDEVIFVQPYGVARPYRPRFDTGIAFESIKMIEVIG